MSVTTETPVTRLPLPAHFSNAEQCFSIKKRQHSFYSSSPSRSSCSSPTRPPRSVPPLPPSKGCYPLSRLFLQQPASFTPLSQSLNKSPPANSVYDPNLEQTYFNQCFTNLGLLGRGSFGEVFKVQSKKDGNKFAIKRSAHRFRSQYERNRSLREAKNHERLCPHPHILHFVAAWEECGRLYIQTELCRTSLLLHAESQPSGPDEAAAWGFLCDLLLALNHMHSRGFVHLDLKPANVLMTESGRLKLADFGLLLEFNRTNGHHRVEEDIQEGDPRYMAPELLCGKCGPAADVFSLGVSILELACNIEVPNGGEGWQKLRQGCLPTEFTKDLSPEFQSVLKMMLAPEPSKRPTVSELLSLPCVKKRQWKRHIYLTITETFLSFISMCQIAFCFGWKALFALPRSFVPQRYMSPPCTPPKQDWDKDLTLPPHAMMAESGTPEEKSVFYADPIDPELSPTFSHKSMSELRLSSTPLPGAPPLYNGSPAHKPNCSVLKEWPSSHFPQTPSSIDAYDFCHDLTPHISPIHTPKPSRQSSAKSMRSSGRSWIRTDEPLPRPNFEPKNLLSLFEETTVDEQP